ACATRAGSLSTSWPGERCRWARGPVTASGHPACLLGQVAFLRSRRPLQKGAPMLHRQSPSRKRSAVIAFGALFALFALLVGEAKGVKKPIIIFARAFVPVGEVTGNGRLVKLQGTGDTTEVWET